MLCVNLTKVSNMWQWGFAAAFRFQSHCQPWQPFCQHPPFERTERRKRSASNCAVCVWSYVAPSRLPPNHRPLHSIQKQISVANLVATNSGASTDGSMPCSLSVVNHRGLLLSVKRFKELITIYQRCVSLGRIRKKRKRFFPPDLWAPQTHA